MIARNMISRKTFTRKNEEISLYYRDNQKTVEQEDAIKVILKLLFDVVTKEIRLISKL